MHDPLKNLADDPETDEVHQPFTAYNQGHDAAEQGYSFTLNPYPEGSRDNQWWANGWMDHKLQPNDEE